MRRVLELTWALGTLVALAALGAGPVLAQEEDGLGLTADVGVSSAYLFRGLNLFKTDHQMDQHALLAPSLTWTIPGVPMQVGYWGAYQLTGDNKSELVDAGAGAEQDLWVAYTHQFSKELSLTGIVTAYYYPLAKEEIVGTGHPIYLEPGAGATWSGGPVDLSFKLFYMHGVQEEVKAGRYLYFNPSVGKTLPLAETVELALSLSAGYKLFNRSDIDDNRWDVTAGVALPISLPHGIYVKPSASLVWTNLFAKDFLAEIAACGAVNVGIEL